MIVKVELELYILEDAAEGQTAKQIEDLIFEYLLDGLTHDTLRECKLTSTSPEIRD